MLRCSFLYMYFLKNVALYLDAQKSYIAPGSESNTNCSNAIGYSFLHQRYYFGMACKNQYLTTSV